MKGRQRGVDTPIETNRNCTIFNRRFASRFSVGSHEIMVARSHSWLATRIPRPFINPAENSRWGESLRPIVCPVEFVDHESRLLPLNRLHAQIDDVNPSRLILSHASYHWLMPGSAISFDFDNITQFHFVVKINLTSRTKRNIIINYYEKLKILGIEVGGERDICIKRFFLFPHEEILITISFYKFYSSYSFNLRSIDLILNPIRRQDISTKQSIWQYSGCQLISSSIPWLFVINQSKAEKTEYVWKRYVYSFKKFISK